MKGTWIGFLQDHGVQNSTLHLPRLLLSTVLEDHIGFLSLGNTEILAHHNQVACGKTMELYHPWPHSSSETPTDSKWQVADGSLHLGGLLLKYKEGHGMERAKKQYWVIWKQEIGMMFLGNVNTGEEDQRVGREENGGGPRSVPTTCWWGSSVICFVMCDLVLPFPPHHFIMKSTCLIWFSFKGISHWYSL